MKSLKVLALVMLAMVMVPNSAGALAEPLDEGRREVLRPGDRSSGGGGRRQGGGVRQRERPFRIDPVTFLAEDSDGDGVPNAQDPCWATAGAAAGELRLAGYHLYQQHRANRVSQCGLCEPS